MEIGSISGSIPAIPTQPAQGVGTVSNAGTPGIVAPPTDSSKISNLAFTLLDNEDIIKLLIEFLLTKKTASESDILASVLISKMLLDAVSQNSPCISISVVDGQNMYSLVGSVDLSNMGSLFTGSGIASGGGAVGGIAG